jgi:drug/metabolite transporter (DMT)-like permease
MVTTELVTGDLFLPGIIYGTLASCGLVCVNFAISTGLAGPASAIVNCCAIIQTVLAYFILGQELNLYQILGFIFGISGAMTFALGDYAIVYVKGKLSNE